MDKKGGKLIEDSLESLKTNDNALVLFTPQKDVCVETFANYPPFGRFVVRDNKTTIAIGVVKEVIYE